MMRRLSVTFTAVSRPFPVEIPPEAEGAWRGLMAATSKRAGPDCPDRRVQTKTAMQAARSTDSPGTSDANASRNVGSEIGDNEDMRYCLWIAALVVGTAWAAEMPSHEVLRGKLLVREGKAAAVETTEHKIVELDGDESTKKVLADKRLNGYEVQAKGHFTSAGRFMIDPFHERGLVAVKDGSVRVVTDYC